MAIEKAKEYFSIADRVQEFTASSATVELAAQALHCEPCRIAIGGCAAGPLSRPQ